MARKVKLQSTDVIKTIFSECVRLCRHVLPPTNHPRRKSRIRVSKHDVNWFRGAEWTHEVNFLPRLHAPEKPTHPKKHVPNHLLFSLSYSRRSLPKMPSILLSALANMTTERLRPIMLDATTTAMPPITKTTTTMFHNLSSAGSHAAQNKRPTIIIYPTGE